MKQFFSDFFDLYDGLLGVADNRNVLLEINHRWEKVLGWNPDEICGKAITDFFHPDESEKVLRILTDQKGQTIDFECQMRNRSGNYHWFHIQLIHRPDRDLHYVIARDISEYIRIRESGESLVRKVKEIAAGVPGLIYQFAMTPSGEMSMPYLVTEGLRIFGMTEEDYNQDRNIIMNMVHPDDLPGLVVDIKKSAENLSPFSWTGRIRTKSGKVRWFIAKSLPRRLPDLSTSWDGVLTDVTNEKELEIALTQERAKSLQSSKLATVGEMAAGIAHEINNPLAIIQGAASMIPKLLDDEEKLQKKVDTILKSGDRISKIVSGLRKFSRTTSTEDREIHSPRRILDEVAVLTNHRAHGADVQVTYEVRSEATLFCNEIEIEQVLVNLINNGIDAAKEGNEHWVRVKVFDEGKDLVFQVTDSGRGIPPEIRAKIFDPFFTTKKIGEGTGLGMSIAQGIIANHDGQICLLDHSEHTCFEVRLPKCDSIAESEIG